MAPDEELETGYRPSTPPGDNLCRDYNEGLVTGYTSLAEARGDRVQIDGRLALTDRSSPSLFANLAVVRLPLRHDGWEAAAARMHAFYGGRTGGPFLVLSAWPTPDLAALGFDLVGHPPLMLRPVAPLAAASVPGLEIRPVTDAASAHHWEQAVVGGFPLRELAPATPGCLLPAAAIGARSWRHWVAYLDGRPVGTASAVVGDHHVDVEFVATLEDARGRGVGRALTVTATVAEPSLPALLLASDAGRPVYERLGYLPLLRYTLWAGRRRP